MSGLHPDFIVHYSRSEPFRSITSQTESERAAIISAMDDNTSWGLGRFKDASYVHRRLDIERRLYESLLSKGGRPKIRNPFYLFLGRNWKFESHPKNIGYVIYLKDLPSDVVTFTYGDSLLSWDDEYRASSGSEYESELCGKLYGFSELPKLIKQTPSTDSLHIEVQLWMSPPKEFVHPLALIKN